jgi:hypothetical protein
MTEFHFWFGVGDIYLKLSTAVSRAKYTIVYLPVYKIYTNAISF